MSAMNGKMFSFSPRDKNLLGFMSLRSRGEQPCRNAVVFIAGMTDGFMALPYLPDLSEAMLPLDYSVVQVNISSSFLQFGIKSLQTDCEDLTELVTALKESYKFEKIIFMGHSTGK